MSFELIENPGRDPSVGVATHRTPVRPRASRAAARLRGDPAARCARAGRGVRCGRGAAQGRARAAGAAVLQGAGRFVGHLLGRLASTSARPSWPPTSRASGGALEEYAGSRAHLRHGRKPRARGSAHGRGARAGVAHLRPAGNRAGARRCDRGRGGGGGGVRGHLRRGHPTCRGTGRRPPHRGERYVLARLRGGPPAGDRRVRHRLRGAPPPARRPARWTSCWCRSVWAHTRRPWPPTCAAPPPASARLVGVEPADAACLMASALAGRPVTVEGPHESSMAGLNCGIPSPIAWPDLNAAFDAFCAITDDAAEWGMLPARAARDRERGMCGRHGGGRPPAVERARRRRAAIYAADRTGCHRADATHRRGDRP